MNQIQREDLVRLVGMGVWCSQDFIAPSLVEQFAGNWKFTACAIGKCMGISPDRVSEILGEVMGSGIPMEDKTAPVDDIATLLEAIFARAEKPLGFADQQQWTHNSNEGGE